MSRTHWEGVYEARPYTEVSWYQASPGLSLRLIGNAGIGRDEAIIDVGGGASTLVDNLLTEGYRDITVLDLAEQALDQARSRLGERENSVNWLVSDATEFVPEREYALWHDRAVLHFFTDEEQRDRYVEVLRKALPVGGHLVLATFGPGGPLKCSGLEIRRYNVDRLQELLGQGFELQEHTTEQHDTPAGATQEFLYSRWTRRA